MPTLEEVQKAHKEELAKRDGEMAKRDEQIATLTKDLETTKGELAKHVAEVAKLKAPPKGPYDDLPAEVRKRLEDSDARSERLEKELREERETRRITEFRKRAEALGPVAGMTTDEVADVLKALPAEKAERLEKSMKASVAQAKEHTALLKEIGRVGRDGNGGGPESPMAKFEVLAKRHAEANGVGLEAARYAVMMTPEGGELFNAAREAEGVATKED